MRARTAAARLSSLILLALIPLAGCGGDAGDDSEAAAKIFENATEITRNRIAELEQLPIPAGQERALTAFIEDARATIPPAERALDAIRDEIAMQIAAFRVL